MSQTDILMKACDWLHFAERTGDDGREWVDQYKRHSNTLEMSKEALQYMRRGQLDKGNEVLGECRREIEAASSEPSIRAVLDRQLHGVDGYYAYCRQDYVRANELMCLAHDAVARAISKAEWLLLLAVHCQEFRLHQARIARNQKRWPAMQAYITEARSMMCDRLPLCVTEDGREIRWSAFQPFFDKLAPLTREETQEANNLLDPQEREHLFSEFVQAMMPRR